MTSGKSVRRLAWQGKSAAVPSMVGTWSCDLDTEKLTWCDGVRAMFGMPPGANPDRGTSLQCYDTASRLQLEVVRAETIRTRRPFTLEARLRTVTGEPRWLRIIAAMDGAPGGRPRLHGVKQDITAERTGWDRLRGLADHDPLTGLAAAGLFGDTLAAGRNEATPGAVLILVDVAPLGRDPGDRDTTDMLSRACALRLKAVFPGAGIIARIGGGRFAVLMHRRIAPPALDIMLRRAAMALRRPVAWGRLWLHAEIVIGAAIHAPAGRYDPNRLQADAEAALIEARIADDGHPRLFGLRREGEYRPCEGGDILI